MLFDISAMYNLDSLSSLSLDCRRLCLEPPKAVVEYLSAFLFIHRNTTREIPVVVVSMKLYRR